MRSEVTSGLFTLAGVGLGFAGTGMGAVYRDWRKGRADSRRAHDDRCLRAATSMTDLTTAFTSLIQATHLEQRAGRPIMAWEDRLKFTNQANAAHASVQRLRNEAMRTRPTRLIGICNEAIGLARLNTQRVTAWQVSEKERSKEDFDAARERSQRIRDLADDAAVVAYPRRWHRRRRPKALTTAADPPQTPTSVSPTSARPDPTG